MPNFGIGPNLATYGSRGRSPSLVAFGQNEQDQADQQLGVAATQESKRDAFNTQAAATAKAGNQQLGATVGGLAGGAVAGAEWGSAAGPWGTLIGGVLGAVAGRFL